MLNIKHCLLLLLLPFVHALTLPNTNAEPAEYDRECFDKVFPVGQHQANKHGLHYKFMKRQSMYFFFVIETN